MIDNTNWVLAIITAVLVGVTAYYAIQTRKTVDEMKKSTEAQFLPFVKTTLSYTPRTGFPLHINNIGKGAARDIVVEFSIKDIPSSEKIWRQEVMMPNDPRRIFISAGLILGTNDEDDRLPEGYYESHQITVQIRSNYKDIFGKPHKNEESIDVTSYVKQKKEINDRTLNNPLDGIADAIREVAEAVPGVNSEIFEVAKRVTGVENAILALQSGIDRLPGIETELSGIRTEISELKDEVKKLQS